MKTTGTTLPTGGLELLSEFLELQISHVLEREHINRTVLLGGIPY